jgi:predicted N-formylglutamate amidohydrolase
MPAAAERPAPIGAGEPAPFEVVNPTGTARLLLTCEHASNRVPAAIPLGIASADLASHIGYDIGAAAVTRRLSALLDAPAILSGYSRLVIDCNRPAGSAESIPAAVAGIAIPANAHVSPADRIAREASFLRPFHDEISAMLARRDPDARHLLLSIHSFTPRLDGALRPWDVGVLQRRSPAIGTAMVDGFARAGMISIANQPYQIDDETDLTIPLHGEQAGREAILIEIRQDRLRTIAEADHWAGRIAAVLEAIAPDIKGTCP